MSQCQPCDSEGEPLPSTELNEAWKLANAPKNDKFQYTHFAHKINSFDTTPKKLLASDSRLRPDRHALEQGDLSKAGFEKSREANMAFANTAACTLLLVSKYGCQIYPFFYLWIQYFG
ncbi:hypothetical protein ERO13_D07G221500v2 [Gossypium hirsutum]|uniref:Oxysterol-binding protein-related protein 3A isoform X2 n=1 Tax=Gossypium hirsutum TaxID=3635 RepID=A0ABM3AGF0_GOSHI|nr:oxysterol-binding protein-related protein 3A isoform X2 [Gossypium hirsutum]XP_040953927.1 oxysterol-binding protein-related protein 3A isoform X2 [Gossypium hirsutum]KAG4139875.1 hypothetical protein ERO13_D07G221500v2 [Gossypium hirsutum]